MSFLSISHHPPLLYNLHLASFGQWCWSGGRGILTELSLCYSLVLCSISVMHNRKSRSFRLVYWISLGLALSPPRTSVSWDLMVLCKCFFLIILTSLCLVEGLAWWDWPLTMWTDQLLSFSAWHCWLGHLTRKIVPDMTYNVFGGTLNVVQRLTQSALSLRSTCPNPS